MNECSQTTFQRNKNNILKDDLYRHVLIYLDDVLTFGKAPEEHLEHLEKVFGVLRKAGLRLKPKKCKLFRTDVHYLGHGSTRMRMNSRRHGSSLICFLLQLLSEICPEFCRKSSVTSLVDEQRFQIHLDRRT